MRRFIAPTVALEGHNERLALESISMEEEQVMLDEANADAVAADSELSEAERIIEITDALEDMAVIADGIEEATPTEIQLIETAGNMAVAGTDVSPEEIVPAMESFQGKKIATEGIREKAASIWKTIREHLERIWDFVENFFYKTFSTIPRLRKTIADMESAIEDIVGKKAEEKLKMLPIKALMINGAPVKDERDLSKAITALSNTAKWAFGDYVDSVVKRGETIAKVIGEFDPTKADEAPAKLREELKALKPSTVPGGSGADSTRFPGFETTVGAPLPGNVSLACKYFNDNKDDASTYGKLDRYRNSRCELIPTSDNLKLSNEEIEFAPMSTSAMRSTLKDLVKLLDVLEEYKRGSKGKALATTKKHLVDVSNKAEAAMAKLDKKDEGAQSVETAFRSLLNFNSAYARWAQTPAVPMLAHSLTVVKAALVLVQKSMKAHK